MQNLLTYWRKKASQNDRECKERNRLLRTEKEAVMKHYHELKDRMTRQRDGQVCALSIRYVFFFFFFTFRHFSDWVFDWVYLIKHIRANSICVATHVLLLCFSLFVSSPDFFCFSKLYSRCTIRSPQTKKLTELALWARQALQTNTERLHRAERILTLSELGRKLESAQERMVQIS